jgi:hypothetical protein
MATTWIQLGTHYPYACIPRQLAPQAAMFAPHHPTRLPVAIRLYREDTHLGTRTCNTIASRAGNNLCISSLGWHAASSGLR